jgi:hypothetical protein
MRSNQEFFDLLAGDIFARLYTMFPEPIDLQSDAILYSPELAKDEDFVDDPDRLRRLYGHAVQWLSREGYVRFSQAVSGDADGEETYTDVVLTAKGLEALRKVPGSLSGPGETLGDKIRAAAKDIGTDAAKGTMKQLVGSALGWIAKGG